MNVERLHRVLIDLKNDLQIEKTVALLLSVNNNLQKQVNQPNQPTHQSNLAKSLKDLYKSLENSAYNTYPPGWKAVITQISQGTNLGIELKNEIENVITSNKIVPTIAHEQIKTIYNNLSRFMTGIGSTLTGLEILGIENEELDDGQCELGYSIPREYVDNKLSALKKEINELNFILDHITEAILGEKLEYKVKTISSSDFILYVIIGLQVADVLSKALERMLTHYKTILEIRELRNKLNEKGVPESKTKSVESHVNGMMVEEIRAIAKDVIEEHYEEKNPRKNELENGLIIALNKLANRIDQGFKVEVRVQSLPEPEEEEETNNEYEKTKAIIDSIKAHAQNIDFIETKGESILKLTENIEKKD
ncbi:hypothetical protein M3P19_00885 [Muricauda sp. 2012CJ35-5]|uniref:Uncharacterized protein n=1 Tax=Flagellimonas spongiicola TaxID=2942208 RepID=A0ABT0PMD4_9FLAO|nr:hypothetical protein [Allomuricauda spongiicola]MCL6272540.1 hypothetical protein [Allomuricauda spongiicola]